MSKKNVLILGSGRSGTSMLAGTLAKAGYFMGDTLYPPRDSNPKGFFEDPVINGINEQILEPLDYRSTHPFKTQAANIAASLGASRLAAAMRTDYPLTYGQRWLERVPLRQKIHAADEPVQQIKEITKRAPFCFKDPRFSYTLPVWRPYLKDTVFLCIFRHPAATAASIVKECRDIDYLEGVTMNVDIALETWQLMYRHILEKHRHEGHWMFVHYNQILTGEALEGLERITGAVVDASFPDMSLQRSSSSLLIPPPLKKMYQHLCALAGYQERTAC